MKMEEDKTALKNIIKNYNQEYKIISRIGNSFAAVKFEISEDVKLNYDIAIYFNNKYKIAIVWNLIENRDKRSANTLSLTDSWPNLDNELGNDWVKVFYKEIYPRENGIYEKVWAFRYDYLYAFPNLDEIVNCKLHDTDSSIRIEENKNNNTIRGKHTADVYNRRYNYREQVLKRFDKKCAICGCDIEDCLEAAHKHGFEVASNNDDNPENGICLCRIHHILYDRNLIEISPNNELIESDEKLKKSTWYNYFSQITSKTNIF